jgi:hypothetical protein
MPWYALKCPPEIPPVPMTPTFTISANVTLLEGRNRFLPALPVLLQLANGLLKETNFALWKQSSKCKMSRNGSRFGDGGERPASF